MSNVAGTPSSHIRMYIMAVTSSSGPRRGMRSHPDEPVVMWIHRAPSGLCLRTRRANQADGDGEDDGDEHTGAEDTQHDLLAVAPCRHPLVAEHEAHEHPQRAPEGGAQDVEHDVAQIRHPALGGQRSHDDSHARHEATHDDGGRAEAREVRPGSLRAPGSPEHHEPAVQASDASARQPPGQVPHVIAQHGARDGQRDERDGADVARWRPSPRR